MVKTRRFELPLDSLRDCYATITLHFHIYFKFGENGGDWTHDLQIKSLLLYQLSYILIKFGENNGTWTHNLQIKSLLLYPIELYFHKLLVGIMGFEPMTSRLKVYCSIQLSYIPKNGKGIETRTQNLQIRSLLLFQLSYTLILMVEMVGFEPTECRGQNPMPYHLATFQ